MRNGLHSPGPAYGSEAGHGCPAPTGASPRRGPRGCAPKNTPHTRRASEMRRARDPRSTTRPGACPQRSRRRVPSVIRPGFASVTLPGRRALHARSRSTARDTATTPCEARATAITTEAGEPRKRGLRSPHDQDPHATNATIASRLPRVPRRDQDADRRRTPSSVTHLSRCPILDRAIRSAVASGG
jgi:hypothetical protein